QRASETSRPSHRSSREASSAETGSGELVRAVRVDCRSGVGSWAPRWASERVAAIEIARMAARVAGMGRSWFSRRDGRPGCVGGCAQIAGEAPQVVNLMLAEGWVMACGRGICGTAASFVLIGALLVGLGGCARRPPAKGIWTNLDGVRAWLDGTARETRFSGVVLIGRDDDVVLEQAYGLADADLGIPMRASHRFRIGSLTKPVTASAVLIAVDRGLLALDQPVCELLPS